MKHQKKYKPINERDKLRQFRELDDAFAKALRDLDTSERQRATASEPSMRSSEVVEENKAKKDKKTREVDQAAVFHQRFHALLAESPLTQADFLALVETLLKTGHWQENEVPRPSARRQTVNA